MDSKVIAITGGSQGLGRALAKACCREGARVAIIGRDARKLASVREEVGERVVCFPCDIGDSAEVINAFREIGAQMGGLDALVNNAGIYPIFKLETASDEQLRSVINTNLLGAM
ncbi:MAG: SDR family oxidoreductase, partial [Luminiphilus sp.]|nr:SDR family oxidoreductase [Luminiphilus sp.]